MQHIPQRIHQLQKGISVRPSTVCIKSVWDIRKHQTDNTQICIGFMCYNHHGQLLEGRLTGNIQPNDPKNLTEGDIYEFSGFCVIHNSRHQKLTQLPYYIQIDQKTITLKVTDIGPIFPVHNFSPQNYKNLLRLATIPTYLPDVVGQILIIQKINRYHPELNTNATIGLQLNSSSAATNFYFNKSIDYIKHFKG
ncbi:hypothetical protein HID58_034730 [Brassica napus]|uniref:Uncharacterized protein n=1 Tax=Brassica napus TaxID=3708 RepID=A0ABQ8C2Y6_BRANA|nr:hypothetical protein HID58_034730 [Brassica napus]